MSDHVYVCDPCDRAWSVVSGPDCLCGQGGRPAVRLLQPSLYHAPPGHPAKLPAWATDLPAFVEHLLANGCPIELTPSQKEFWRYYTENPDALIVLRPPSRRAPSWFLDLLAVGWKKTPPEETP